MCCSHPANCCVSLLSKRSSGRSQVDAATSEATRLPAGSACVGLVRLGRRSPTGFRTGPERAGVTACSRCVAATARAKASRSVRSVDVPKFAKAMPRPARRTPMPSHVRITAPPTLRRRRPYLSMPGPIELPFRYDFMARKPTRERTSSEFFTRFCGRLPRSKWTAAGRRRKPRRLVSGRTSKSLALYLYFVSRPHATN